MEFKDFTLHKDNHFIAMQYHSLILNRTNLILLLDHCLLGLKVNGIVGVESGSDPLALAMSKMWAIKGDLESPESYIKSKYLSKIENLDIFGDIILEVEKSNFRIFYKDIIEVTYNKKKKWGMGYYPHDGRVYVKTKDGKKREFIILGTQSGKDIQRRIENKYDRLDIR